MTTNEKWRWFGEMKLANFYQKKFVKVTLKLMLKSG